MSFTILLYSLIFSLTARFYFSKSLFPSTAYFVKTAGPVFNHSSPLMLVKPLYAIDISR